MSHLDSVKTKYATDLQSYAAQHPEYGSVDCIFNTISSADPDNNRYVHTQWLVSRTLNGTILWEDIAAGTNSKAHDILERFLAIRTRLPSGFRDLYQYPDLPSVTTALMPYEAVITSSESEDELRERVNRDTLVLCDKDGYKIVVPMSKESSCYWGRGTQWCTAASDNKNMFHEYHKEGPLVIVITPDGKKFQFHQDSMPMDENDKKLSNIEAPILAKLSAGTLSLEEVSVHHRTRDICMLYIDNDINNILYIPESVFDYDLSMYILEAFKGHHIDECIKHIPKKFRLFAN